ncbi:MAG: UbiD family decarboxylase [Candidatus Tectomicrobia bacterium]|nr:UbiD family decarboxylase [Candidatus Tectomicrobia bacterium]
MEYDLRAALRQYQQVGELVSIGKEIDPRYELSAVLWKLRQGPAVCFEKVKGSPFRVVGNVINTRRKLAIALGIDESEVLTHGVEALENPLPCETLGDAPCKEVKITPVPDLSRILPIPNVSEHDGGPYITAGIAVARHPETGQRNYSIHRMQFHGGNVCGISLAPTHLSKIAQSCRALKKPLELAISIGNHPVICFAACMYVPSGHDELEVAGGMLGKPVQLVKCETVDLEVPAASEIVLEGELCYDDVRDEGPFGEFHGAYAAQGRKPTFHVKAVTHRKDALYQTIVGSIHPEHLFLTGMPRAMTLYRALKVANPRIQDIAMTNGGCGLFHAAISVKNPSEGEGKRVIFNAFGVNDLLKKVTVVDDDIDVHDPVQVEWATATRMHADRDVFIVPHVKASPADPLNENLLISKMGIDATKPRTDNPERFKFAFVPKSVYAEVEKNWESYVKG